MINSTSQYLYCGDWIARVNTLSSDELVGRGNCECFLRIFEKHIARSSREDAMKYFDTFIKYFCSPNVKITGVSKLLHYEDKDFILSSTLDGDDAETIVGQIGQQIHSILSDRELERDSVIQEYHMYRIRNLLYKSLEKEEHIMSEGHHILLLRFRKSKGEVMKPIAAITYEGVPVLLELSRDCTPDKDKSVQGCHVQIMVKLLKTGIDLAVNSGVVPMGNSQKREIEELINYILDTTKSEDTYYPVAIEVTDSHMDAIENMFVDLGADDSEVQQYVKYFKHYISDSWKRRTEEEKLGGESKRFSKIEDRARFLVSCELRAMNIF